MHDFNFSNMTSFQLAVQRSLHNNFCTIYKRGASANKLLGIPLLGKRLVKVLQQWSFSR